MKREPEFYYKQICHELNRRVDKTTNLSVNENDLQMIKEILTSLSNPEKKFKVIHLAGTNGKGSTAIFIAEILREAGYKVGLYTSPHLAEYTERIKINNEQIKKKVFCYNINLVLKREKFLRLKLSGFEILTVAAFLFFADENCEIVVLETGLGGRLDATNVIDDVLAVVLTTIDFDHANFLGNTLTKIADEKCGIIKNNCKVISYKQQNEVDKIIKKKVNKKNSQLNIVNFNKILLKKNTLTEQVFDFGVYKNLTIQLIGKYQLQNAALAITAIEEIVKSGKLKISEKDITNGLNNARWPGRLEIISFNPIIILDGAHNSQGIKSLAEFLSENFLNKKIYLLFGMLVNKNYIEAIKILAPLIYKAATVTVSNNLGLSRNKLTKQFLKNSKEAISFCKISQAVNWLREQVEKDELIVVCGSLYMLNEVRGAFLGECK